MTPDNLQTVPNYLSIFRLLGSPVLIVLAILALQSFWLVWFVLLLLSDWLDGKLAQRLDQATVVGAKLDSVADAAFYAGVLASMLWLQWTVIAQEWIWIALALSSYGLSLLASFHKFGRYPSYHTRLAKTSWFFVCIAVVSVVSQWSAWPVRFAMGVVLLANLEATLITIVLPQGGENIPSVFQAIGIRRETPNPQASAKK